MIIVTQKVINLAYHRITSKLNISTIIRMIIDNMIKMRPLVNNQNYCITTKTESRLVINKTTSLTRDSNIKHFDVLALNTIEKLSVKLSQANSIRRIARNVDAISTISFAYASPRTKILPIKQPISLASGLINSLLI